MAGFLIRLRIEQFKHIVPKVIELNESLVSIVGVRDFYEQSILMEVFAFVFGDEFPQIQNADVTAEFREFSVRCTKVYGQSHYYYGAVFGNMEELGTKAQYCDSLLEHGINCGTQSFLISAHLLDQYSSDGIDLRSMLEPALTKSRNLLNDQREMAEKYLTDRNMKKKWEIIEHIYNVLQRFYLAWRENQRILREGNDKISRDVLILQLAYRRQQIMKTNEFLVDERESIPVKNIPEALFEYVEKTNVRNKGYILVVTGLSCEQYFSKRLNDRKRINENKLNELNKIDDNVLEAIIQHYNNDLDLELGEFIAKLFNSRAEKDFLKCNIAIIAEPVDSMEKWGKLFRAMSKNLKRHETTAKLMRLKVLKMETACEQQEWLSCAKKPTTMLWANEVINGAVYLEYGVQHRLHHIDADLPPVFDGGDYNGAVCMRVNYQNVITSDDWPMSDIDYAYWHCVDDSFEIIAMHMECFGIVDATNRKKKQKPNQILINITDYLEALIKNAKKNQTIKKQMEDVNKWEIKERRLLEAKTLRYSRLQMASKQLLNDLWHQKMNGILGTLNRKFPISAEHILCSKQDNKLWDNVLKAEIQKITDKQIQIDVNQAKIDRIMDDLENEIKIQNISSVFQEQTEFYNLISDSIANLQNIRMKQLHKWYLIRNESLMDHIRMELRIDHDDDIVNSDWDPNQYIQRLSPAFPQFEMDELKTILIRLQEHWFHISKHPKILYFDPKNYYERMELRKNRCINDINKTNKMFKNRCHTFQKPFEHFRKICYDEMVRMEFSMPQFDMYANTPALRHPIEIITNDRERDEAFNFTKWNTYFTAFWMRFFLNLAIEAPIIICDSFDYYLMWEQRNQIYRYLRRVAQQRQIQVVLMSRKSVDIVRNDEVFLMWHTNAARDQTQMARVSNWVQTEEPENMEGIEESTDEDEDLY